MKIPSTKYWLQDTIIWLLLCIFTYSSYHLFESKNNSDLTLILPLAFAKLSLVYFFFMRMKTSHYGWFIVAFGYVSIVYLEFKLF